MFKRKYIDSDEWESVSEDEARKKLDGYYNDVDTILNQLRSGLVIRTPWAFWKFEIEVKK